MRKPRDIIFKIFTARLTEINNFLPLLPGYDSTRNIPLEEINEILLFVGPNGWAKQAYVHGWEFRMNTFRKTCAMFKQMEISEQVYKGQTPSKIIPRADSNRDSHVRKRKLGEAALPTNHKNGRSGK